MPKPTIDDTPALAATETPAEEPTPMPTPVADTPDIALEDWCSAKSRVLGRRIEALGAYHKLKQREGVGRATSEWFEADFQTFLKTPV